ncbi:cytochrome P450 2J4-like [Asterias amurensis]|uniref:cytochrome P450 2J4-like n=1 Tax=Asterias amurensis TaxID=7602 RepID=UPI003AB8F005
MGVTSMFGLIDLKTLLLGIAVLLGVYWLALRRKSPRNLPPGPTGWPLLGYLPKLLRSECPSETLMYESRKHGEVLSVNLAGQLTVVLNSAASIREGFNNPLVTDRPLTTVYDNLVPNGKGVATSSGKAWSIQRRFCLTALRGFGFGKASFEDTVSTETSRVIEEMRDHKGAPFNPTLLFLNSISNIICSVSFGKTFEYSDPKFQKLLSTISRAFELTSAGGPSLFLPLAQMVSFLPSYRELMRCLGEITDFVREEIEAHRSTLDVDDPRDLIDHYLIAEHRNLDEKQIDISTHINADNMVITILEIFMAGTETTSSSLRWAVLYLMEYPEVQTKIQQEIDRVVGRNRFPRLADRPNMPFIEATIMELQRISPITPLPLARYTSSDTEIQGYSIPKDTVVLANLMSVCKDESLWEKPDVFDPGRFIKDGKMVQPDDLVVFGAGRRVCLGEGLARMELFITLSNLLHQFTFKKPEETTILSFKATEALTRAPLEYKTRAILRD